MDETGFKIKNVTAFIAEDKDGTEGVMAYRNDNDMWMPLICADEVRVEQMFPMAEHIAKTLDKPFRVIQFAERKDITEETIKKFKK